MSLPRLVAFDLDDTLAPSKTPMQPVMIDALSRLVAEVPVCIISGGNAEQFRMQVIGPLTEAGATGLEQLHLMPTCGTQYYRLSDGEWQRVYAEVLTDDEIARACASLEERAKKLGLWEADTWGPRIENRETQVTFSALGQSAPVAAKAAWDPDSTKKSALRDAVASDVPDLEVRSGGSTSVDITRRGIDKAYGMRKLETETGIPLTDVLFVGDRLDVDGNDYPVIATGVATHAVEDWNETAELIGRLLADR